MNGSTSAPSSATMNGNPMHHQPGDEMDVAGEAIELRDNDGALFPAGLGCGVRLR